MAACMKTWCWKSQAFYILIHRQPVIHIGWSLNIGDKATPLNIVTSLWAKHSNTWLYGSQVYSNHQSYWCYIFWYTDNLWLKQFFTMNIWICSSLVFCSCDKTLTRSNLWRRGFISAYTPTTQSRIRQAKAEMWTWELMLRPWRSAAY